MTGPRLSLLLLAALPCACRTAAPATGELELLERRAVEETLERLYDAFCFDAGGPADWETIRELAAPGAAWFAPVAAGASPRGVDTEAFLADFRAYVERSPLAETGFHERVRRARIDVFGTVAHAYVAFDAFVPGAEPERRGLDSVQLLLAPDGWRVASFTTQWETSALPLPERFR